MLKPLIDPFLDTVRHLNVVRTIPNYFDREERRLVVQSLVIGVVVWAVVFALKTAVHFTFHELIHFLEGVPIWIVFVPLIIGALVTSAIIQWRASVVHYRDKDGHIHELIDAEGDGLERAISLYYTSEPTFERALTGTEGVEARWQLPTFSLAFRKFFATLTTLGSGGSGGLEASVTLIGESLAAGLFKPNKLLNEGKLGWFDRVHRWWQTNDPDDLQTAQLCGISAAVSVLLGAPFAAAFFATEVMYRKRPLIQKLLYALISALVAYFLTDIFTDGHTAIFEVEQRIVPPTSLDYFGVLALVAFVIALVSNYFGRLRHSFETAFHRFQPNAWVRHTIGAIIVGLLAVGVTLLTESLHMTEHGLEIVLGPGETIINMALAGELTLALASLALFAKMIATLATIGSGGSAGLLVPSLFFGTMVAAGFADLFNFEPMIIIIPAMTATLVSIVNVPLAAILFTVEVFGTPYMVPALIMLIITSILAHDNPVYRSQRETQSKRQILPGVSVKRIAVPAQWDGKTLIDLDFRNAYEVDVIGLVEHEGPDGRPHTRLGNAATTILEQGDILVVLGSDEKLEALQTAVAS